MPSEPPPLPSRVEPLCLAAQHPALFTGDNAIAAAYAGLILWVTGSSGQATPDGHPPVLLWAAALIALVFGWLVLRTDARRPFEVGSGWVRLPYGSIQRQLAVSVLIALTITRRGRARILVLETEKKVYQVRQDELVAPGTLDELKAAILRELSALPDGEQRIRELQRFAASDAAIHARRPYATYALTSLIIVIFSCQSLLTTGGDLDAFLRWGANAHVLIDDGQWFRTVTANFLHADLSHVAGNLLGLVLLGALLERVVGAPRFLIIFLSSAWGGALASHLAHVAPLSLGASTGIFGLQGAWLATWFRLPSELRKRGRTRPRAFLTSVALGALLTLLIPKVDHAAHAGGFMAGIVVTWVVTQRLDPLRRSRSLLLRGVAVVLVSVFLVAGCQAFVREPLEKRRDLALVLSDALALAPFGRLPVVFQDPAWLSNWSYSITQQFDALPEELTLAAQVAERALALSGTGTGYELDSLATAYFRLGRIEQAIDTEAKAMHIPARFFASQLARFLRAHTGAKPYRGDAGKLATVPALSPVIQANGPAVRVRWEGALPAGCTLTALLFDKYGGEYGVLRVNLTERDGGGELVLPIENEGADVPLSIREPVAELQMVALESEPHESARARYFRYDESVDSLP